LGAGLEPGFGTNPSCCCWGFFGGKMQFVTNQALALPPTPVEKQYQANRERDRVVFEPDLVLT